MGEAAGTGRKKADREARLAEALRANLKRRKAAKRADAGSNAADAPEPGVEKSSPTKAVLR